jgi:hypothetical protein
LGEAGSGEAAVSSPNTMAAPERRATSYSPAWPILRLRPSFRQILRRKSKFKLSLPSEHMNSATDYMSDQIPDEIGGETGDDNEYSATDYIRNLTPDSDCNIVGEHLNPATSCIDLMLCFDPKTIGESIERPSAPPPTTAPRYKIDHIVYPPLEEGTARVSVDGGLRLLLQREEMSWLSHVTPPVSNERINGVLVQEGLFPLGLYTG